MRFTVNRLQTEFRRRRDIRVNSLTDAYLQLLTQRFDLILILPDVVGANQDQVLARLRDLASGAPVLVLSETAALGASDVRSKDLMQELAGPGPVSGDLTRPPTVSVGPIVGYRASGMITANGDTVNLSPSLSRILWRLLEAPQHHCKTSDLVDAMANPELPSAKDTLRVHMSRLRSKLAAFGCDEVLVTGRGFYWLQWPQSDQRLRSQKYRQLQLASSKTQEQ